MKSSHILRIGTSRLTRIYRSIWVLKISIRKGRNIRCFNKFWNLCRSYAQYDNQDSIPKFNTCDQDNSPKMTYSHGLEDKRSVKSFDYGQSRYIKHSPKPSSSINTNAKNIKNEYKTQAERFWSKAQLRGKPLQIPHWFSLNFVQFLTILAIANSSLYTYRDRSPNIDHSTLYNS